MRITQLFSDRESEALAYTMHAMRIPAAMAMDRTRTTKWLLQMKGFIGLLLICIADCRCLFW